MSSSPKPAPPVSTVATWRPTRASMHTITFAELIGPEARAAVAEVRRRLEEDTE